MAVIVLPGEQVKMKRRRDLSQQVAMGIKVRCHQLMVSHGRIGNVGVFLLDNPCSSTVCLDRCHMVILMGKYQ